MRQRLLDVGLDYSKFFSDFTNAFTILKNNKNKKKIDNSNILFKDFCGKKLKKADIEKINELLKTQNYLEISKILTEKLPTGFSYIQKKMFSSFLQFLRDNKIKLAKAGIHPIQFENLIDYDNFKEKFAKLTKPVTRRQILKEPYRESLYKRIYNDITYKEL